MWFTNLTGLNDDKPKTVRSNLRIDGDELVSDVNSRRLRFGRLETPSLGELRIGARASHFAQPSTVREVVADAQELHADPRNADSLFQVASQFNLLEMVSPSATPEDGVAQYAYDLTQGPACAMACGGALLYRNYFVGIGDQLGQSETRQIDCAFDLGEALGNNDERLWRMRNGYLLPSADGLSEIRQILDSASSNDIDDLRGVLRVGLQTNAAVTLNGADHCVQQVFCSAAPIAYSSVPTADWEPLARLILEAAYEATLLAAVCVAEETKNRVVYLTLLGGGAFGNPTSWIVDAIEHATSIVSCHGLDTCIVSYRHRQPAIERLLCRE